MKEIKSICKLCNIKEANQTGSHLTSCFIVASQIGKREEEKGYLLTSDPEQDYTINHGAEQIKEDYIFCSDCEKRLSFVEGYFSQEFTQKIDKPNYSPNFPIIETNGEFKSTYYQCNNLNPIAFHLLIYSIIWRVSISNKILFQEFSIPPECEENIKFSLDLHLPEIKNHKIVPSRKQWLRDLNETPDFFTLYPYVILKTNDSNMHIDGIPEEELETLKILKQRNPLYFAIEDDHPYHIILNEFIILPFFKEAEIQFQEQDFFELNDKYDLKEQMNLELNFPKVGIVESIDWSGVYYKLYKILKDQRIYNMRKQCMKMFLMNHRMPTKGDIEKCVEQKQRQYKLNQ